MLALEALVQQRGGSTALLKKLRTFRDREIQIVSEKRNRAAHDPIYIIQNDTIIIETIKVSPKGLTKLIASPSIDQLRDTLFDVKKVYDAFLNFSPGIEALYPTSE
jgi:hypothetical protein